MFKLYKDLTENRGETLSPSDDKVCKKNWFFFFAVMKFEWFGSRPNDL